mmetsp:Transcript_20943/g.29057  ORF Transcript_20943/g.29057 Transcript_20943/m.29057 type:complete len:164 (+) Transcript_20943:351-842(+)
MMDLNALNIANKWFASTNNGFNELRESVFQARFLHRMPSAVESSTDPITPPPTSPRCRSPSVLQAAANPLLTRCMLFGWYLAEVYPGLLEDQSILNRAPVPRAPGLGLCEHCLAGPARREVGGSSTGASANQELFGTSFFKSKAFHEPPGQKKKELGFADREV